MILDAPAVLAAGERIGLASDVLAAVRDVLDRVASDLALARTTEALLERLANDPSSSDAIAAVRAADVPFDAETSRTFYLVLALAQIPAAEARHAARDIDPSITRATMADVAVWVRHFAKQIGARGITLEILEWAQRYLRGDLLRVGSLQFDLVPFASAIRVYREPMTRELAATDLDGRAIDLTRGEVTSERFDPSGWELVLAPGTPVLDMHVPADSFLSIRRIGKSIYEAVQHFARLSPGIEPRAVAGEAWILDPQVRTLLPRNAGIHALQAACRLYPSALPEAKTIRRLFGPDVVRADLPSLPRDRMNSLQRAVVDLLACPDASLRARGGFILREELERMEAYRP